jgi:hypothetical protein
MALPQAPIHLSTPIYFLILSVYLQLNSEPRHLLQVKMAARNGIASVVALLLFTSFLTALACDTSTSSIQPSR